MVGTGVEADAQTAGGASQGKRQAAADCRLRGPAREARTEGTRRRRENRPREMASERVTDWKPSRIGGWEKDQSKRRGKAKPNTRVRQPDKGSVDQRVKEKEAEETAGRKERKRGTQEGYESESQAKVKSKDSRDRREVKRTPTGGPRSAAGRERGGR